MTFSDKIKRSREVAGLTQQGLADLVGVSKRTIASYECTNAMARRSTVVKLARALKVSVKYLTDLIAPILWRTLRGTAMWKRPDSFTVQLEHVMWKPC